MKGKVMKSLSTIIFVMFVMSCGYETQDNDSVDYGCPDCKTETTQLPKNDRKEQKQEQKQKVDINIGVDAETNCCDRRGTDCEPCPPKECPKCPECKCKWTCSPDNVVCAKVCPQNTSKQSIRQKNTVTQSCPEGTTNCNNNANNNNNSTSISIN
jgi:hypothetical protein